MIPAPRVSSEPGNILAALHRMLHGDQDREVGNFAERAGRFAHRHCAAAAAGRAKAEFANRDFYDVWLPNLSPSQGLVKQALAAQAAKDEKLWAAFARQFRAEMKAPDPGKILDLLAALSHHADFAVGCYCPEENWCHRSILRQLLVERGARIA